MLCIGLCTPSLCKFAALTEMQARCCQRPPACGARRCADSPALCSSRGNILAAYTHALPAHAAAPRGGWRTSAPILSSLALVLRHGGASRNADYSNASVLCDVVARCNRCCEGGSPGGGTNATTQAAGKLASARRERACQQGLVTWVAHRPLPPTRCQETAPQQAWRKRRVARRMFFSKSRQQTAGRLAAMQATSTLSLPYGRPLLILCQAVTRPRAQCRAALSSLHRARRPHVE